MREAELFALVGSFYDALLRPSLWPSALESVSNAFGAVGSIFFVQDRESGALTFSKVGRLDVALLDQYEDYYASVDIRLERCAALPAGAVFTDETVMTRAEYFGSEIYNDFFKPGGLLHVAGIIPVKDGRQLAALGLQRSPAQGPFDSEAVAALSALAPHIT